MLIWAIIKKAMLDFWEEVFYLLIFNMIWVVGSLLIIPYPFVTFGLFYTVRDVGQGKGIKFSTFFGYGRQYWKPAYIWGGLNLAVLFVLWFNVRFYGGIITPWAAVIQLFFMALTLFWMMLQLIVLALYPRLVEPGFKLAVQNGAVIMARNPAVMVAFIFIIILLGAITMFFPILAFLLVFSFAAMLSNSVVEALVERELGRLEEKG